MADWPRGSTPATRSRTFRWRARSRRHWPPRRHRKAGNSQADALQRLVTLRVVGGGGGRRGSRRALQALANLCPQRAVDACRVAPGSPRGQGCAAHAHALDLARVRHLGGEQGRELLARTDDELLVQRSAPIHHGEERQQREITPALADHEVLQRSEEHTSELQSPCNLVCRLLLEKKIKYDIW